MTDGLSPEQSVAYILFKNSLADIERAAKIDTRYAEFWGKVEELYAEYADQLRP